MPGRIRGHLRSNVVAYLALFFALTGSAVALDGTNTVFSDDIVNGEVASPDVKDGSIGAVDIRAESIGTNKIKDNDVRSGDILDGTISTPDIGASQIFGGNVADESLRGADIDEFSMNLTTATGVGFCSDDDENGDVCASTTITLGEAGKVLANASGEWHTFSLDDTNGAGSGTDNPAAVGGTCVLRVDSANIGNVTPMGELSGTAPTSSHPTDYPGTMGLTGLSGSVGIGPHTVDVFCTEVDGDLDWDHIVLTVQGSPG